MRTPVIVWSHYLTGAERGNPELCPVSRAIKDQTGIGADVIGDVAFLEMRDGTRRVVRLPDVASRFVRLFDSHGMIFTPLVFMLDTEAVAEGWDVSPQSGRIACEAGP